MSKNETVRLTLDVSRDLNNAIETLAEAAGTNKSDILRRSINLMEFAYRESVEGKKVGSVSLDKTLDTEVVGLGFPRAQSPAALGSDTVNARAEYE